MICILPRDIDLYSPFLWVAYYRCLGSVLEISSNYSGIIERVKTQKIILRNGKMFYRWRLSGRKGRFREGLIVLKCAPANAADIECT